MNSKPFFFALLLALCLLVSGCGSSNAPLLPGSAPIASLPAQPAALPSPSPSPTATLTPSPTVTPLPLPSQDEMSARFDSVVQPLVDQLLAAGENAALSLPSDAQVLYIPRFKRQYIAQVLLGLGAPIPAAPPVDQPTIYLLYEFSRGRDLVVNTGEVWLSSTQETVTQELTTDLRLLVWQDGKFQLVEQQTTTSGVGNTSLPDLVQKAIPSFARLPGDQTALHNDLQQIIAYACGIDLLPNLDYGRKVFLLTYALNSKNWSGRRQAADALGALDPPPVQSAPALISVLYNQSAADTSAAGKTLASLASDPAVFNQVIAALSDPDENLRSNLGSMLSHIDTQSLAYIPTFVKLLHDPDIIVRGQAQNWLSGNHSEQIVAPMLAALHDPQASTRASAAQVLNAHGDQAAAAVPALTAALQDADHDVRDGAAMALHAIGAPAKSALPALADALRAETFGSAFNSEAGAYAALDSQAATLPLLRAAYASGSPEIRAGVCMALDGYRDVPGARELLNTALTDPDQYVRDRAEAALSHFGP